MPRISALITIGGWLTLPQRYMLLGSLLRSRSLSLRDDVRHYRHHVLADARQAGHERDLRGSPADTC